MSLQLQKPKPGTIGTKRDIKDMCGITRFEKWQGLEAEAVLGSVNVTGTGTRKRKAVQMYNPDVDGRSDKEKSAQVKHEQDVMYSAGNREAEPADVIKPSKANKNKKCKCGATDHQRQTFGKCALNPKNQGQ